MKPRPYLLAWSMLLAAMLACNLPTGQNSGANLPGTITAQALTLQARTGAAVPPTESPVASGDTSTPAKAPVPAASTTAATSPPQPTKTPKASKTPEPTATLTPTATQVGPNAPFLNQVQLVSCTATTINGQPGWLAEVKAYWRDNSSDEDYFLIYRSTALHPEKVLVSAPPPNSPTFTWRFNYLQSSVAAEPYDMFYLAAYNASGTSFDPFPQGYVERCTKPF